jgi:hypothetical protein
MAFDRQRRRTVYFGGLTTALQNDGGYYDGTKWTPLTGSVSLPAPRMATAMAYDAHRNVTVLFGGSLTSGGATGATNDTWELAAVDVPLINEQPASQYRQAGETAVFSVQAVAAAGITLQYQWYLGSEILAQDPAARISGLGTATLQIQNVSARDAGAYWVKVSNQCGAVGSHSAVLTLDPKLQIFSSHNTVTLVWSPDPDLVLEVADRVTGPWTLVPNPAIPFHPGSLGPMKFYRLRVPRFSFGKTPKPTEFTEGKTL